MDPDRLTNKDAGMGKIITRIVTMLAMFTAIIPLNIPYAEEGSYNAYLNENGLLFGTLYSYLFFSFEKSVKSSPSIIIDFK